MSDQNVQPEDAWLTPQQFAERLGVSPRWVRERVADGTFPAVRIGHRIWITPANVREIEERHAAHKPAAPPAPLPDEWLDQLPEHIQKLARAAAGLE